MAAKKKAVKTEYPAKAAAEKFMESVVKAMEQVDEFVRCTEEWDQSKGEEYPETPPLLKTSATWREAVDPPTLKKFEKLVSFMTDVLFGVDCDHSHAVRFQFVDQGREENFLPGMVVKRVPYEAPLDKRLRQVEIVKIIRSSIDERLKTMERILDDDLKSVVRQSCIKQRAKDCPVCKGKGCVETDKATWDALDYGERCRTREIGCDYRKESRGPFRLFCTCQEDIDAEEDEDDEE